MMTRTHLLTGAAAVSAALAAWISVQSIAVSALVGLAVAFAIEAAIIATIRVAFAVRTSDEVERQRDRAMLKDLHEAMLKVEADDDWRRRCQRLEKSAGEKF